MLQRCMLMPGHLLLQHPVPARHLPRGHLQAEALPRAAGACVHRQGASKVPGHRHGADGRCVLPCRTARSSTRNASSLHPRAAPPGWLFEQLQQAALACSVLDNSIHTCWMPGCRAAAVGCACFGMLDAESLAALGWRMSHTQRGWSPAHCSGW